MANSQKAWAVRAKPHHNDHLDEFLDNDIVGIGWPDMGDLIGRDKDDIREIYEDIYNESPDSESGRQAVGTIDRFANQIEAGDPIVVPTEDGMIFGEAISDYYYDEDCVDEEDAFPHRIEVKYKFGKQPIPWDKLPPELERCRTAQLSVFEVDYDAVMDVINNPGKYR